MSPLRERTNGYQFRWSDPVDRRFARDILVVTVLGLTPAVLWVVFMVAYPRR